MPSLFCRLLLVITSFSSLSFGHGHIQTEDSPGGKFRIKTIVVDAGHGGRAAGAMGSYSLEKNVTLALALKLQAAINREMAGIKVVMTRTTDAYVNNGYRAVMANESKGDLYICLHCNSLPDARKKVNGKTVSVRNHSGKGVLLLVYAFHRTREQLAAIRENEMAEQEDRYSSRQKFSVDPADAIVLNAYRDKFRKQSIHLAGLINNEFVNHDSRPSLGVIEQGVQVLANSAMPSVLVETGFINNPEEEDYLNSASGQNEIVNSIVRAIKKYAKEVDQTNQ
ncbi:N-acetylmuramoyl-L-alanine amidase [Mucilaginibacter robiniae]|uniref:N-acetylmuramoyl-L-alanine amidase n=1 Tax=Mucilaginibacter robiniae TaxID=2728022 RepID=A0A7L5E3D7_9SPHI|nr:N-acetylmuramoyl-L-alanine amidase [Mucilaginibacter robiniae]QJD97842.1 N-acetylmuramoyl-L-alanine amidase [Mucilaginibacter robiniae]